MARWFAAIAQNGFPYICQIVRIVDVTKMQVDKTRIKWRRKTLLVFGITALLIIASQQQIFKVVHFCLFERFLHIPCPVCGISRSFYALANLNVAQSLKWSPFGIAIFLVLFLYISYLLIGTLTRAFENIMWSKEVHFVNILDRILGFFLLANWFYQLTFN